MRDEMRKEATKKGNRKGVKTMGRENGERRKKQ